METKVYEIPRPTISSPSVDWLLFFVLSAIAIVGASAFVIGYVLLAAAP